MEPGQELFVAELDLSDAFHHMQLPLELRKKFGLKPVVAKYAGISEVNGRPVKPGQKVGCRCCTLPMGFTHALNLCQKVLLHHAEETEELEGWCRIAYRQPTWKEPH